MKGGGNARFTIRVRLTLLFSVAFFLLGLTLVGVTYIKLDHILAQQLRVSARAADLIPPGQAAPAALPERGRTALPAVPTNNVRQVVELQFEYARRETLNDMLVVSLVFIAVFGVAAGGTGWIIAGRFLRPLREITGTARQIAGRTLHQRIALAGPKDEIKDLADTLDAMLERLDRAFDSQKQFIANASHELRTPLALNRTLIEVEMLRSGSPMQTPSRDLGRVLLDINERHERLIEGLLTLATSDQPLARNVRVDLADIVRHVLDERARTAGNGAPAFTAQLDEAVVHGDPVLLERAVQNLLENASRYNIPEGGWVTVSTATSDDRAILKVENTGPVISAQDVPVLLEPFRRLPGTDRLADRAGPEAHRGAGLGLSIVRAVSQAHDGELLVEARQGGGLRVSIILPVASAD